MLNSPGQFGSCALWDWNFGLQGPIGRTSVLQPPCLPLGFLVLSEFPAVSDVAETYTRLLSEAEQPGSDQGAPTSDSPGS